MHSLPPSLLFLLAQFFLYIKRHTTALRVVELLLERQPDHQRALSIAGFLYAEKGRFRDAVAALERSVAFDTSDGGILFNLAFALQRVDRHKDAIGHFRRAVELQPALDRAWYGMGLSLIQLGQYAEAIESLTEAARLQPFNPFARYQLAAAWFKLGEHEKVRDQYRVVAGFDPRVATHISQDFGVPKEPG